jgi:DNA polymerase
MLKFLIQDYETSNLYLDLPTVGSRVYAEHWATRVECLRWLITTSFPVRQDAKVGQWLPGDDTAPLLELARDPEMVWVCFGAFEIDILRCHMMRVYGLPDVPDERWSDIQASCAYRCVGLALDEVLQPLCGRHKDMEGNALTLSLSAFASGRKWHPKKGHPRTPSGKLVGLADRSPEKLQRIYQYCEQDVRDETEVLGRVGFLPGAERRVWLLDQRVNNRGVRLDLDFIRGARHIVGVSRGPLVDEFKAITGGVGPGQVAAVRAWLASRGVEVPNLRKETVSEWLGDDDEDVSDETEQVRGGSILPDDVRRALHIRALTGGSSVRKLSRMEGCIASDGRAHRLLQYHGTGPGRWAPRLFNILNFPRPFVVLADTHKFPDPERVSEAITSGNLANVNALGLVADGRPASGIEVVSSSLRHAVIAEPGKLLVLNDYVQMQARLVLALSGGAAERAFLYKMAAGCDPYSLMADKIYHLPEGSINKKDHPEQRHTGKNTFLGCGFMMGSATYCKKYVQGCECRFGAHACQPGAWTPAREFAQTGIDAYRGAFQAVKALWHGLYDAAFECVATGHPRSFQGITYALEAVPWAAGQPLGDRWLTAEVLDGSKLHYWHPRIETVIKFGKPRDVLLFDTVGRSGKLVTVQPHGGLLTENVIMRLERQMTCAAIDLCEQENYPVIFNSYDEIVCEVEEARADHKAVAAVILESARRIKWPAQIGVPIELEGCVTRRYKK